jgi:acyl dehydratase
MEQPYYEDLVVGTVVGSDARTITEADVLSFAGLTGDFNPLHVDAESAKSNHFGQRIAHGLLGVALASGLRRHEVLPRLMALMEVQTRFTAPIFIGDTVRLRSEILEKRESRSKPDRGIVVYRRQLLNQRDEVVHDGRVTMMIARRPQVAMPSHDETGPRSAH